MAKGIRSNAAAVAGRTSSAGEGAKLQGGTRTQIPVKASPKIKGGADGGGQLQGGTKTQIPVRMKGSSSADSVGNLRSIRNSSFGGNSKPGSSTSPAPEA